MLKKKIGIYALILAMAAAGLAGCGTAEKAYSSEKPLSKSGDKEGDKSFSVVCTIFPEYDWTKEILGEHADDAEITYLLDNGVDLHNYQPTADDILKISSCDLFVYVGGESDEWVENALAEANNEDMKVVELMDVLGDDAKVEELKEGMQEDEHEHEHEHSKEVSTFEDAPDPDEVCDEVIGHGHSDEDEHEHSREEGEEEYDEHVWLSVKNAKTICGAIEKELEAIDPDNAADYKANLESYTAKLDELDNSFKTLVDGASSKTLVFGDRFPFRYFVDDYGLDYYAAFIGCSAETEASFETIAFLADKVNELDCGTIFTLENSSKDIANSIISASGKSAEIAELNSLQSISADDIANGTSYLSIMQKNYDVLAGVLK